MFDNIKCERELPLNEELKSLNLEWSKVEFQTKDLDNCLSYYRITPEGDLVEDVKEYEYTYYTKEELKEKGHKPWNLIKETKVVNEYVKHIDFHGKILFYDIIDLNEEETLWVDFNAYFVYGKLDKIELANTEKHIRNNHSIEDIFEKERKRKKSIKYKLQKYSGWFLFWKIMYKLAFNTSKMIGKVQNFSIKNMHIVALFFVLSTSAIHARETGVNFFGNVNYAKHIDGDLSSSNTVEYKYRVYNHHKFIVSLSNAVTMDYDVFNKSIKEATVFNTLLIEF